MPVTTNTRKLAALLGASGGGIATDGTLTSTAIGEVIVAGDIAAGAVGSSELADDAVGTDQLANDVAISTSGNIATTGSGTVTSVGLVTAPSLKLTPTDTLPASATGSIYYDDSEKRLKHYDGTEWAAVNKTVNYDRPGDGEYDIDQYTQFLMHSNTTDGSTTFTDSSANGATLTGAGGVMHSNNQFKTGLGATSVWFQGTDDKITCSDVGTDLDFLTGDFVVDFWYNRGTYTDLGVVVISQTESSDSSWWVRWINSTYSTSAMQLCSNQSSSQITLNSSTSSLAANTWYHYAAMRSGTTSYIFKNGVQIASNTSLSGHNFNYNDNTLIIGARINASSATQWLYGYVAELRVSVGTDRGWSSGFTVY